MQTLVSIVAIVHIGTVFSKGRHSSPEPRNVLEKVIVQRGDTVLTLNGPSCTVPHFHIVADVFQSEVVGRNSQSSEILGKEVSVDRERPQRTRTCSTFPLLRFLGLAMTGISPMCALSTVQLDVDRFLQSLGCALQMHLGVAMDGEGRRQGQPHACPIPCTAIIPRTALRADAWKHGGNARCRLTPIVRGGGRGVRKRRMAGTARHNEAGCRR